MKHSDKHDKVKLELPEIINCEKSEQETIITKMRDDDYIQIYTCDNTMLTKLKKLMAAEGGQYEVVSVEHFGDGSVSGVTVRAPERCLSLRAGKTRELSDEEREALAARMREISSAKKK